MRTRVLLVLLLAACHSSDGDGDTPSDGVDAECPTTPATWENLADPVLRTWCTPCHSESLTGPARSGAPDGVDFDDYADVASFGALISAAVADERMPPSGGLPASDRDALIAWVECGMPREGTDPVEPALRCADPVVVAPGAVGDCTQGDVAVDGDLTVSGNTLLDCVCEVRGDLVVHGTATLAQLRSVRGDVDATAGVTALFAPRLAIVDGVVRLGGGGFADVDLSGLEDIGGLEVDSTSLTTLRNPRLGAIRGDLVLSSNRLLTVLPALGSVRTIDGSVRYIDNAALETLALFGQLDRFDGDLEIRGNDALDAIVGLYSLPELGGDLTITQNKALTHVNFGYSLQRVVGAVRFVENVKVDEIEALPSVVELGALEVSNNPKLDFFGGFPALASVRGDLVINNDDDLRALRGLEALREVEGDLVLTGNAAMEEVGLAGVTSVGGDLTVAENPKLPAAVVDTIVDGAVVGGAVDTTGNGG